LGQPVSRRLPADDVILGIAVAERRAAAAADEDLGTVACDQGGLVPQRGGRGGHLPEGRHVLVVAGVVVGPTDQPRVHSAPVSPGPYLDAVRPCLGADCGPPGVGVLDPTNDMSVRQELAVGVAARQQRQ
jgi:hypothetical protein